MVATHSHPGQTLGVEIDELDDDDEWIAFEGDDLPRQTDEEITAVLLASRAST